VRVVETKVALPALVVGSALVLVPELYGVLKAYGFDPTPEQDLSIVKLGAALAFVVQVVLGYRAPHTPRPDLPEHEDVAEPARRTVNLHPGRLRGGAHPAGVIEQDEPPAVQQ
jgi:hypothetical protein